MRYAYAITVQVKRPLPPPPPSPGLLLGLVRRTRPAAPTKNATGGFSTKDLHVPFTVLSKGPDRHDVSLAAPAAEGGNDLGIKSGGEGGGGGKGGGRGEGFDESGGGGGGSSEGVVASVELEVERQTRWVGRGEREEDRTGGYY